MSLQNVIEHLGKKEIIPCINELEIIKNDMKKILQIKKQSDMNIDLCKK